MRSPSSSGPADRRSWTIAEIDIDALTGARGGATRCARQYSMTARTSEATG